MPIFAARSAERHFSARGRPSVRCWRSATAPPTPPPLIAQNHFAARVLGAHKFFQLPAPIAAALIQTTTSVCNFICAREQAKRAFLICYVCAVHALGMKFTNALCAHQNWFSLTTLAHCSLKCTTTHDHLVYIRAAMSKISPFI